MFNNTNNFHVSKNVFTITYAILLLCINVDTQTSNASNNQHYQVLGRTMATRNCCGNKINKFVTGEAFTWKNFTYAISTVYILNGSFGCQARVKMQVNEAPAVVRQKWCSWMRHHFSATFHIIQSILLASEMRTFLRISCCCLASGSKWRSLQRTQPISESRSAFMFHNHTLLQCVLVGMHMHTFTVLLATIPKQCNVRITFHYRSRHYFYIARL